MNKRLLILLLIMFLISGGIYWVWQSRSVTAPSVTPEPVVVTEPNQSETSIDTSNWKTYRNEEYGFEVKYPKDWIPPKAFQEIGGVLTTYLRPEGHFEGCCQGVKVEIRNGSLEKVYKDLFLDYPKEEILSDVLEHLNGIQVRRLVFLTHYGDKNEKVIAIDLKNNETVLVLRLGDGDDVANRIISTLELDK